MSYLPFLSTRTDEYTFIDGFTLYELPHAFYREYAQSGLFSVDHHDALRFEGTAQVIATTREQFDILIDELGRMRDQMRSRN